MGQGRGVDVLRQRQLLEATREQQTAVEALISVRENALAVLLGEVPGTRRAPQGAELPSLPPLLRTGTPLAIINRRPDVQSAFLQLKAADADLASAIAERYPRLNVTAALSTSGETTGDLFQDWLRSLSSQVIAPLFDAGSRAAEADRAGAARREALATYQQNVLTVIQEVEDSLIREQKQRIRIAELNRQVSLARRSYEQLLNEYFNGVGDYIGVLIALTDEQRLRRDLITARATLVEYRIAVYRALGGSLEGSRETPMTPKSLEDAPHA